MIIGGKKSWIFLKLNKLSRVKKIIRIFQYKLSIHIKFIKHLFVANSHQNFRLIKGMFIPDHPMEKFLFTI